MLISPAYAQAGGLFDSQSAMIQFLPLVLIFVVFYFLLIRPQQTRQKETRSMLSQLKRGDRVVTAGGIVGRVSQVPAPVDSKPSREVEVEIASGVKAMVVRDTITGVVNPVPANDAKKAG